MSNVSADNFVEAVRANVDNKLFADSAFRQFVRNTLQVVENGSIYTATYEFGVCGYQVRVVEFTGNFDSIKAQIHKAAVEFVNELEESNERVGNLSEFVPELGNGYPSLGGFSAELGTDYTLTLLKIIHLETKNQLSYNHIFCEQLRGKFGG